MTLGKYIIVFVLFFLGNIGKAQDAASLNYHPTLLSWENGKFQRAGYYSFSPDYLKTKLEETQVPSLSDLKWQELQFDVQDLPVFCRIEVQMEKAARIPIKFRLGEVQYVEKMEGKY